MSKNPVSLDAVLSGQTVFVVGVEAGRKASARLESLGLIPGSEVSVLTNNRRGPLLIAVQEGRVMVERGIARKVKVA